MKSESTSLKLQPFELLFTQNEIQEVITDMGARISKDYEDKNPILLGVLKGCFVFVADLIRAISIPTEVEFISAHSYGSSFEPGTLTLSGGPEINLKGRHILMVEGVVDTGRTAVSIVETLKSMEPASVEIVTLLDKTGRRELLLDIKYAGIPVKDDFVIGYGLDYNQLYRNLPFIGKVIDQTAE
ncbi:MAG: hypoxanthine phosphoribosyltransferase [candidate division Zixibacteria bacterium]|nr:hypoxanthine phosphoribosyltransferase [candidate division Zixibacteria bacterium]